MLVTQQVSNPEIKVSWLLKIAGAKEWLASQGIAVEFINFAIGNDDIPRKLQKWMAIQLNKNYEIDLKQHMKLQQYEWSSTTSPEVFISNSKSDIIAISDWYRWVLRNAPVDINQYDWHEALEQVDQWQDFMEEDRGKGHPSFYKYPKGKGVNPKTWREQKSYEDMGNGFIMVEVPDEDLPNEGAIMQHCVGDEEQEYAEKVNNGETIIYSLRDAKGWPHVTIEVSDENYIDKETAEEIQDIWEQDESHHIYDEVGNLVDIDYEGLGEDRPQEEKWVVEQIQGKQDQPPIDKYRPYIYRWLQNHPEYQHSEDQILSVSPESELLAYINANRMNSENFNKVVKHLSEDTKTALMNQIMADGGKGWSAGAVESMIMGLTHRQIPLEQQRPLLKSFLSEEFPDVVRAAAARKLSTAMIYPVHHIPGEREWVKEQLEHERYSPQVAAYLLDLLKDTSKYDAKKHKNVVYDYPEDVQDIALDLSDRFSDPGKFPMAVMKLHQDILGGLAQSVDPDTGARLVERAWPRAMNSSYEMRMHLSNLDPQHFYNIWTRLPQKIQRKLYQDDLTVRGYSSPPIYSHHLLTPHERSLEQWNKYDQERGRVENNNKFLHYNKLTEPEVPQWQEEWHPEWELPTQASSNWLIKIAQTGTCFRDAALRVRDTAKTLVHGEVQHPLSGNKMWHAWVEDGQMAEDCTLGPVKEGDLCFIVPISKYYEIFQPSNVRKYSDEQAMVNLLRAKHWGPWEEVDLTVAQRRLKRADENLVRLYSMHAGMKIHSLSNFLTGYYLYIDNYNKFGDPQYLEEAESKEREMRRHLRNKGIAAQSNWLTKIINL